MGTLLRHGSAEQKRRHLRRIAVVAGGERVPRHARRIRFAREYDVGRKFRETRLYSVAPISNNLVLAYLGEHVLGLPRSY